MIKIEITDEIKAAVDLHWKWIAHRFRIEKTKRVMNFSGTEKGAYTRARNKKKELYELLHFITPSEKKDDDLVDSKDDMFEKLIRASPKELLDYRKDSRFAHLVFHPSSEWIEYNNKKKKLNKMRANDPNAKTLKDELEILAEQLKDEIEASGNVDKVNKLLGYRRLYDEEDDDNDKDEKDSVDKDECEGKWDAYELCKKINLSVCPYCNRQYIFTVFRGKKGVVRPQLDHFFPKSVYPFLSCSFFNLIPSCPFCNQGKGDKTIEIIYPYLEEFGKNFVFKMDVQDVNDVKKLKNIKPKDIDYSICLDDGNLDVSLDQTFFQAKDVDEFGKLLHASDKVFNLTELYQAHQVDLKDLLEKYVNVTGANLDELADKYYKGKGKITDENKQSLRRILLGLPIKIENADYPLRKFKEDIIDQLDKER